MARPLRKVSKKGHVYTRPGSVETNIDGALGDDLPTLKRRLAVKDRYSPDYLTSECLVHLIRESQTNGDLEKGNLLIPVLLIRCEAILNSKIDATTIPNATQLREDILGEFAVMLAYDDTEEARQELDFYECAFNSAFRTLRIDMVRREHEQSKRFRALQVRSPNYDEDGQELFSDGEGPGVVPTDTQDFDVDDLLLESLLDNERKAFVLHYIMGHEIESIDGTELTVAKICNVEGRTVRNWLRKAKQTLAKAMKEQI